MPGPNDLDRFLRAAAAQNGYHYDPEELGPEAIKALMSEAALLREGKRGLMAMMHNLLPTLPKPIDLSPAAAVKAFLLEYGQPTLEAEITFADIPNGQRYERVRLARFWLRRRGDESGRPFPPQIGNYPNLSVNIYGWESNRVEALLSRLPEKVTFAAQFETIIDGAMTPSEPPLRWGVGSIVSAPPEFATDETLVSAGRWLRVEHFLPHSSELEAEWRRLLRTLAAEHTKEQISEHLCDLR